MLLMALSRAASTRSTVSTTACVWGSISILTLAPSFFLPSVVRSSVSGIKCTQKRVGVTSPTVRLIPSIPINPLYRIYFISDGSWTLNHTWRLFSEVRIFDTSAVVIIWPDIKCPPISSLNFAARSTLTKSPTFSSPRLVIRSVSFIRSKLIWFPLISVTVRQHPLWATDAPVSSASSIYSGNSTTCVRKFGFSSMDTNFAVPCTIPVNILPTPELNYDISAQHNSRWKFRLPAMRRACLFFHWRITYSSLQ